MTAFGTVGARIECSEELFGFGFAMEESLREMIVIEDVGAEQHSYRFGSSAGDDIKGRLDSGGSVRSMLFHLLVCSGEC
jgi:hypothetical protein